MRTHAPPPRRTVLLCEFMWSLEQELEDVTPDDDEVRNQQIITDPNKWFMRDMVRRAAQLW